MIREVKSPNTPSSLSAHKNYDGQDVLDQLFIDHHEKCYLCELKAKQHYHVEHLKSKENYSILKYEWSNLFLSDDYCNGKKSTNFDEILNPEENNIEDIIEQRIDSINRKAFFRSSINTVPVQKTIELLDRLFNGTYAPKLRRKREDEFFKEVERIINSFNRTLLNYLIDPNPQTEKAVRDELSIDKELLGFKYWIIKDHAELFQVFANDIIWNKR